MLGLLRPHLQRAIAQGRVPAPPLVKIAGIRVRLWSRRDVERARAALRRQRTARRKVGAPAR